MCYDVPQASPCYPADQRAMIASLLQPQIQVLRLERPSQPSFTVTQNSYNIKEISQTFSEVTVGKYEVLKNLGLPTDVRTRQSLKQNNCKQADRFQKETTEVAFPKRKIFFS